MKVGALDINNLYAGGTQAVRAYVGTTEVWRSEVSSDELWYTSTNGQIVPISGATGITVVSNTYTGGKGVIKFSGTLTTIPYNAFGDQTRLASVELSEMVTVIEDEAFFGCGISSITIPGVVSIGNMAFSTSGYLSSIVLPSSLTNIGNEAFAHCTGLTSITYEGTMAQWALVTKGADWFLYVPATVVHCTDGDVFLVPKNKIFYTSTNNQVVTPNVSTGYGATINSNAYSEGLGVITFNGTITSIPASGFSGCTTIQTIALPDTVTSIGIRAFSSVSALTEINISDYVTSIGDRAFQICTSATSINIGSGMRTFGNKTFANTGVVSVVIPDTITDLGSETFLDCKSLVEATIGSGVTNIGTYCLGRCTKLATINYNGTKSQWNSITKGNNWHVNSIATVVHCTDGDVNI